MENNYIIITNLELFHLYQNKTKQKKNLSNAGKGWHGLKRIDSNIVKKNHIINGFYSINVMTICIISRPKNTSPMHKD